MTTTALPETPSLHIVNLTITGRCNLDCPCCYQKRRKDDMTTLQVVKIIDEIADLGTEILMMPGGEPLLRQDLDIILRRAADRGLKTYLASNATLITDERARELKECGLTGCCVGVEVFDPRSLAEVDRRGLAKTIEGLQSYARAGLDVFANLIVTRDNLRHLPATVKLLVSLGIRKVTILRPKPVQSGSWFEQARLGPREMYRLQIMKIQLEAAYDLEFVNLDCAFGALQGGLPMEFLEEEEIPPCLAGTRYLSIDSNGDVYPCAYLKHPEFRAGNVTEAALPAVFNESPVFDTFREPKLEGHCGTCPMSKHCGGCRALAYHDHGRVLAQDDDCHWGTASKRRVIWQGTVFWATMIWRLLRTVTRTRSKGSARYARRVLQSSRAPKKASGRGAGPAPTATPETGRRACGGPSLADAERSRRDPSAA